MTIRLLKKALIFSAFFYAQVSTAAESRACPATVAGEPVEVRQVFDGDTVQLVDGRKVRLIGIDTPEIHSRKREIPVNIRERGEAARRAVVERLRQAGQRVTLNYGSERFDRYQRTLAYVYLPDGTSLQAWLIRQGHAIAFTTPPNDQMGSCFQQQEQHAREAGLGIWEMPEYQLKTVDELARNSRGFHRLTGKVSHIYKGRKGLVLKLDGRVDIKIPSEDLVNFDHEWLKSLMGRQVEVRGWLSSWQPEKAGGSTTRFSLRLRHPHSIQRQK